MELDIVQKARPVKFLISAIVSLFFPNTDNKAIN